MIYNIISCASFGSSGSSVITDYLSEYKSVKDLGTFEFRFVQDYMGISSLEDALVTSPHRLNSDIAIQNYLRYVDRQCGNIIRPRYQGFFKNKWKEISLDYLRSLVDVEWPGYWEEYQIIAPKYQAMLKYQLLPRIKRLFSFRKKYIGHYLPTRPMFFSFPSEEKFLNNTRKYINELCKVIDPGHEYKYLMFDQLMPPANIGKYERYFYSIKTIVVDRDPRDYFLENALRWGEPWMPKDVEKFAVLYRKQREQARLFPDSENVLRIQFEDTIFKYQEFEKKIQNFLGLENHEHVLPLSRFNPAKSIKNTMLWESRNNCLGFIKKIEELLPEYLYDFDSFKE